MPLSLPLLGMGTWGMGGKYKRDESNVDESIAALRYGLKLGIRLIDVAELYGQGLTEEIVGKAIAGIPRSDVFIISKVWKTNLHYDDVIRAAKGSLARLKTDYIDLYLVHWPNEAIPLAETMGAMEQLVNDGLVRQVGVSNFTVPLMREAMAPLKHTTIAANQIEYNIVERSAEQEVIPFCKEHGIRVIAYRPFAKGKLAGQSSEVLNALAKKYGKTEPQIVLNWLTSRDIVAIPKAMSNAHIFENYGALGWTLAPEDITLINKTHSGVQTEIV